MWCHILLHYMHTVPYCSTICGHTVPLYAHGAIYCSTICTWCHTAPLYVAILFHYILLHYMWCHITPLYVVPYYSTICGAILFHYMWCHTTPLYVVPYYSTICGAILLHYMCHITRGALCIDQNGGLEVVGCWNTVMRRQEGRSNPWQPLNSNVMTIFGQIGNEGLSIFTTHCKVLSFCFVYYAICIVTFDSFPRPPPDFIFLSGEMRHLRR